MKGKILKFLNDIEQHELTGDEIKAQLGYPPILYEDLAAITTVDQLLQKGNGNSIIILYQQTRYSGHYTLLYRRENALCFFDPYGLKYDSELQLLAFKNLPHLTRILAGQNCVSSRFPMQKYGSTIADCGSWTITRLRLRHLTDEQFAILFKENEASISADQLMLLMNVFTVYYKDANEL